MLEFLNSNSASPIITVVEAKNENLISSLGQGIAEYGGSKYFQSNRK